MDLSCSLRNVSYVACKLWVVACEILFSDQESNWGPLHWEHRVLSTGPPGKSLSNFWPSFFYSFTFHSSLQTQHQFAPISCSLLLHGRTIFWVTQEQSFFFPFLLLSLELLHPLSLPLVMVLAFFSLLPSLTLKSTVCCSLAGQLCPTLCGPMDCSTPGFPVLHHLRELAQIHVYWFGDATRPSHHLLPPSPPAFSLSQHQGLSQLVDSSYQVAKVLELQLSISPSSQHSGLISCGTDWFDLLAVQGTLRRLLQHHSASLWLFTVSSHCFTVLILWVHVIPQQPFFGPSPSIPPLPTGDH